MGKKKNIVVYSTSWCSDCRRAKEWLTSHSVAFDDINIEESDAAMVKMQKLNGGLQSVPTILFPDGSVLVEPSNKELEEHMKTYV